MSQTTQRTAEVTLSVDTQGSESKLDGLKAKAAALRKEFSEAFKRGDTKEIDRISREINKVNKETSRLQTNAQCVRDAMMSLDRATPKQLQNTIKMINAELNSGRVPRGTKQWQEYVAQLNHTREELRKVNAEMGAVSKTQDGETSFLNVFCLRAGHIFLTFFSYKECRSILCGSSHLYFYVSTICLYQNRKIPITL